jgi:hypothetical protein
MTDEPHEPISEPDEEVAADEPAMINIRNLSIKCGHCNTYQTLCHFERRDEEWNVYTYECENDVCDPAVTRTYLEVPAHLDAFARRDPGWRGGRRHAGAH